ncbi:hypothetical protein CDAR_50041 [Caerostris darwini]|uniref:Uncharacterized protein n=1 Tax=Caerostris darwini TaxID=1538125 RepID=A0AAV4M637_9ARAC|nr:hypothetical protein CDAR_50041 [Caerostris darwini]
MPSSMKMIQSFLCFQKVSPKKFVFNVIPGKIEVSDNFSHLRDILFGSHLTGSDVVKEELGMGKSTKPVSECLCLFWEMKILINRTCSSPRRRS